MRHDRSYRNCCRTWDHMAEDLLNEITNSGVPGLGLLPSFENGQRHDGVLPVSTTVCETKPGSFSNSGKNCSLAARAMTSILPTPSYLRIVANTADALPLILKNCWNLDQLRWALIVDAPQIQPPVGAANDFPPRNILPSTDAPPSRQAGGLTPNQSLTSSSCSLDGVARERVRVRDTKVAPSQGRAGQPTPSSPFPIVTVA